MSVYCKDNNVNETDIQKLAEDFLRASCTNMIPPEKAIAREFAGVRLFGTPTVGYIPIDDPRISEFEHTECNKATAKGSLPAAETIVTVFLPFTDELKECARKTNSEVSDWIHSKIEGKRCADVLMNRIRAQLLSEGYDAAVLQNEEHPFEEHIHGKQKLRHRWSHRHAADCITPGTSENGYIGGLVTSKKIEPAVHIKDTDGHSKTGCKTYRIDMRSKDTGHFRSA